MALVDTTERSPLLRQLQHGQNLPADVKPHDGGERGASNSVPPQGEQLSNARLALIMGSIWVCSLGNSELGACG